MIIIAFIVGLIVGAAVVAYLAKEAANRASCGAGKQPEQTPIQGIGAVNGHWELYCWSHGFLWLQRSCEWRWVTN